MKSSNFVIELLEDRDGNRTYIVRTLQGQPITKLSSSSELATFFDEFQFATQDGK